MTRKNLHLTIPRPTLTVMFFFVILFASNLIVRVDVNIVNAHHERCANLTSPDRIVGCNEQALRAARAECERQHQDATALQNCYDDAARHQGINPESGNATPPPARTGDTGTGQTEIDKYLATGVNILTAAAGLAITGSIVLAGMQYMTARDNASQVSAAKNRIFVSVCSLLLLGFGYAIIQWLIPGGVFK